MVKKDTIIKLTDVCKTFPMYTRDNTLRERILNLFSITSNECNKALSNVNLEIKEGEFFGVIGHNGSGKSTLLQIMSKVMTPDKGGEVVLNGTFMRLALGMGFNQELSGRQNIYINASILGLKIMEIDKKIDEIIEFSELGKFIDSPVKIYSTGMRSRLMFAIAVNAKADIFFIDEFFGGVGDLNFKKNAEEVFQNNIVKGRTIVHVSHNMATIKKHCDRVLVLDRGAPVAITEPGQAVDIYTELMKKKHK